jgi:hypothetical protein
LRQAARPPSITKALKPCCLNRCATLALVVCPRQVQYRYMSLLRGNCFISALRLRGKQKKQKWVGRYREDVVKADGSIKRTRHSVVLGTKAELPTERLARRRLDEILSRVNSPEYRPGRISTVKEFSEWWKSQVLVQLKPSTIRAAQAHLRCHIVPHLGN